MSEQGTTKEKVIELDSRRPHVVEKQYCYECFRTQVSTRPADVVREWWECGYCGEMSAKAVRS